MDDIRSRKRCGTVIKGLDELKYALNKFALDVDTVTDNAVRITAFDVLKNATQAIKKTSQGIVIKSGKSKTHTVSKKGDAPNTDTGRLIGSIAVLHNKGAMIAEVGTNVTYGAILETTLNRPWLVPAKDKATANFQQNMTRAIDAAIKKATK